jgi:hypothetical protein
MIARSFRLVTGRLIPRASLAKLTPLRHASITCASVVVAAVILAGCGGSPQAETQSVAGAGYRFSAPAGWTVKRSHLGVTAMEGAALVQVSTFPLVKTYRPALFAKVAGELKARMAQLAQQTGGKVAYGGPATAGGVRSHVYRLSLGGRVDEYTFVLVGRREYQLLCRAATAGDDVCKQLQASFTLT